MGNAERLDYVINKAISPKKVLLIDDPKVMETIKTIQIAIYNLPDQAEIKKNNPLDGVGSLIAQFHIKSGVFSKGMVGGYQKIGEKGKPLDRAVIEKNHSDYTKKINKEFDKIEHGIGSAHDKIFENWNLLVYSASTLCESKAHLIVNKKTIEEVFSDKDKTLGVLRSLYMDIRDNKEKYKARLGIGVPVGAVR